MTDKIQVETTTTSINVITVGSQGPAGPKGESGILDESVLTVIDNKISQVRELAEVNQLNITKKADIIELEQTQAHVEDNRLALLNKADLTALAILTTLVNTKADQVYVQEQIANLVNGDQSILTAITEISNALQQNEDLLEALEYTVANRVRFDVASQALTSLQKSNARTNIGAEEAGTAAMLIAQITAQSIGAATAAQGAKANTALQSADVAPVALSGLFSSLSGQNKIFDVIHSAYQIGANSTVTVTDTLGQMLGKLQAQINANKWNWVSINSIGTLGDPTNNNSSYIEEHFIDGVGGIWFCIKDNTLYMKALFKTKVGLTSTTTRMFTITDAQYQPKFGAGGYLIVRSNQSSLTDSSGAGATQLAFGIRNLTGSFYIGTQQSLLVNQIIYIPPTPVGLLN